MLVIKYVLLILVFLKSRQKIALSFCKFLYSFNVMYRHTGYQDFKTVSSSQTVCGIFDLKSSV